MVEQQQNHAERPHALWSASSTTRNVFCSGAIALQTLAPKENESIHAARGTACHTISEKCLAGGGDAIAHLGTVVKTKAHEVEIDEEICVGAQEYVDYVMSCIRSDAESMFWFEQQFTLAGLNPPMEAGGTADTVLYYPSRQELHIVDLKFGRGVVDVEGNPQLRTYALGALLAFPELNVESITVTIVQPRAAVKGETIRSETFHATDIIDWSDWLLKAMRKSARSLIEFEEINGSRTVFDEWSAKWLTPGKCVFCKAEGYCPALKKEALSITPEAVKGWFEDLNASEDPIEPLVLNQPALMSPEERAHVLDGLDMLEDWVKAVRASEHTRAERGDPAPGYILVDKIGNRKFTETDEAKLVGLLVGKFSLKKEQLYESKILSPARVDKIVGTKKKAEVDALCTKPKTGTNLVAVNKTTRPPAASKVEQHFEKLRN
jgi:hypothetical protein